MSETATLSDRQRRAFEEAGRTGVRPGVARALVVLFLATVAAVPLVQTAADLRPGDAEAGVADGARGPFPEARDLVAALPEALATWRADGFFAANRELLAAMDAAEERLERTSWLRARLLPPVQAFATGVLGLGNEQAYPGRRGWLFYRADVDHVVGRGFLDPAVVEARRRGGDAWIAPPEPDPLPVLLELDRRLAALDVELLVMPTPVKPSVHPELFAGRYPDPGAPARNPSYGELIRRLEEAGVALFDPAEPLMEAKAAGEGPLYLRTDTHWAPEAMEAVAGRLAERIAPLLDPEAAATVWLERRVAVEGLGDVAAMLQLPDAQRFYEPQRVTTRMVLDRAGRVWRSDPAAPVLLLGDSFTNVFSDPALGWGSGAGLAERLAYHLERPVDRIAQNAGGARASREALARALESDPGRLAPKRAVVYQFATRELSQGDWQPVELEALGQDLVDGEP